MSKATIVYISMFMLFGAGLSAVLAFGDRLAAPPDISGTWQVRPVGAELPFVGEALEFEQSGKYVRVRTTEGHTADLKLTGWFEPDGRPGTILTFTGDGMELTVEGSTKTHQVRMRLTGPVEVAFDARRTVYLGKPLGKGSPLAPASAPATPAATTQRLSVSPTDSIDASER